MLKNVDFKKMSYDEGLALVAETRKKSLQGSHVKQANSMVDAVKKYWDKIPPEAKWSLLGAGTGGLGGLASSLIGKKDDEDGNYGRNILTGALLGGLTGYGGRLGYDALNAPVTPTADTSQAISSAVDGGAWGLGHSAEFGGLVLGGKKLGDTITADMRKNKLSGTKITNPAIDPSTARTNLNNYLAKVQSQKNVFDPKQQANIEGLNNWVQKASDDDIIRALSDDGFLGKNMGKSWISKNLTGAYDLAKRTLPLSLGRPMAPATTRDANLSVRHKPGTFAALSAGMDFQKTLRDAKLGKGDVEDVGGYMKRLSNAKNPMFRGSWKKPSLSAFFGLGLPLANIGAQLTDNYTGLTVPTPGAALPGPTDGLRWMANTANPANY